MADEKSLYYDAQPDIYRFNFCGYNGSFRKIPSENSRTSFLFFDCPSKSQSLEIENFTYNNDIDIVDGNGYKYTFVVGEYSKGTYSDAVDPIYENRIRQWNLQKITAPNGRTMEFIYFPISDNGEGLDKSSHNVTYTPSLSYVFSFFGGTNEGYGSKDINIYVNDVYSTRLAGIRFADGTRVDIEYVAGIQELCYMIPNGKVGDAYGDNRRINSIKVYNPDGTILKKATFSYKTVGGNSSNKENRLTFLKSIDVSGLGVYSFEYNPMMAYPPLGTIKSDHWGYYNGESGGFAVNDFFSNLIFDNNYNESYTYNFKKNPDFQAALSGTLCKIGYPTGGFSNILYESHDCSQKVIRADSTRFLPWLIPLRHNEMVGGVRIKQVQTYQSDGTPIDTVQYEYRSSSNSNLSSGILIHNPRYGIKYITSNKAVERFNLCNSIYDYTQTHIEYSHVREYKSSAGYTDYFFNTYDDYPDEYDAENSEDKDHRLNIFGFYDNNGSELTAYFTNPDNYVTNLLTPFASAQTKRGLIYSIKKYDNGGVLVSDTKYNYIFPLVRMDTIFTLTGEIARDVHYPRHNIFLRNVVETQFFNNTAVSNRKTSEYNNYGMETKTESLTSDGHIIIDEYQYSGDSENATRCSENATCS